MTRSRLTALAVAASLVTGGAVLGAAASNSAAHAAAVSPSAAVMPEGSSVPVAAGQGEATLVLPPAHPDYLHALASARGVSPSLRSSLLSAAGPSAASVSAVTSWAAAAGFSAVRTGPDTIEITGPVGALAAAFGTTVTTSGSSTVADRPLSVPAAVSGAVSGVVGLDTRQLVRPRALPGPGYTPAELASAYSASTSSTAGASVTVATVQFEAWHSSDATSWASAAGISSPSITEVDIAGHAPGSDAANDNYETALDVEAVLAGAPAARQLVYDASGDANGILALYGQLATDAAAHRFQVLSTSWGLCEPQTSDVMAAMEDDLDTISAAGVTILAASGDAGAYDCDYDGQSTQTVSQNTGQGTLAVDYPASSPDVLAVGGTSVNGSSAAGWTQSAWSSPSGDSLAPADGEYAGDGTGGGVSSVYPKPAYQSSVTTVTSSTRMVPDLSLVADPDTGFGAYINSQWSEYGGTSLSAPLMAGYLAATLSASSGCSAASCTGYGDIHQTLYDNPGDFTDVTSGDNLNYNAGAGYDLVSGLGTPVLSALAATLNPGSGGASAPSPSASAPSPSASASPSHSAPASATAPASVKPSTSSSATASATLSSAAPTTYSDPVFIVAGTSRSSSVPVTILGIGAGWSTAIVAGNAASCTIVQTSSHEPTTAPLISEGVNVLTLVAVDPSGACHRVVTEVVRDTTAPRGSVTGALVAALKPASIVKLTAGEPVTWSVTIARLGKTATQVLSTITAASALALKPLAPGTYTVTAIPTDGAGNVGARVTSSWVVPLDDRGLKRSGHWGLGKSPVAFAGTVLTSTSPGSRATGSGWGTSVTVGYLCLAKGGVLTVLVDGRPRATVDLSCARTRARTAVVRKLKLANHTVTLQLAGGRHGSQVSLDDLIIRP